MKILTTGQIFPHKCQIKDMKLSGFTPNTIRYHCVECGGVLVLRLEREQWESVFGSKKSLKLTKKILESLDALTDDDEIENASAEMGDPAKFVWQPPDDDEDED